MCFGVESQVVGYDTIATTNGNMGVGATFVKISEAGTMADIKIGGYTRPYDAGQIYCALLDTFGRGIKKMYWFDHDAKAKPKRPARYGWYSDDGSECYNTDPIEPGQALWMSQNANYNVQNAGQVLEGTFAVALTNGNQFVSNPMPVATAVGNVHITGYTRPYDGGQIYCSVLDTFGRSIKRMYWFDHDAKAKPKRPARYGWYSDDGATCYNDTEMINPGEALWTTADREGLQMVWPSALPAAE